MVDFVSYPANMHHDFELYSNNQEQTMDYPLTNQPFMPSSTYGMEQSYSASYDPMMPLTDAQRPHDLHFHYDAIAQGVKPFPFHTPAGSPHSTSHSFHEQPPILSASSESDASVSSSAIGSPTHFEEPWNSVGLGLSSGFEYPGMIAPEKTFVGESTVYSTTSSLVSSIKSPTTPFSEQNTFKTPVTPASAKWPLTRSRDRRNSLLSHEVHPCDVTPSASSHFIDSSLRPSHSLISTCWFPSVAFLILKNEADSIQADPNLIQPFAFAPQSPFPEIRTMPSPYFPVIEQPPSPALSYISSQSQRPGSARIKQGSASPYLRTQQYHPYPQFNGQRRGSVTSLHSQHSGTSRKSGSSYELDDETREKGLCPLPECGRVFKDLKAHMLTHQNERPEKCPIATCEYHVKGFARKYDKNRHTLTHYKGTMVCGFCPGSGSAAEKSFNRADVFKRHLTSVHGVEQNPPNSRKKSPGGRKAYSGQANVAGTCSTCSVTFANAQEFYEHLDDCVLRVVQQADPSEAINQRLLTSVAEDKDVTETLDRNGLSKSIEYTIPSYDEDDEVSDEEEPDNDDQTDDTYGSRRSRSGKGSIPKSSSRQH
jgi:hypothetical protein